MARFREDADSKLELLRQTVIDGTFRPSEYRTYIKRENGKDRLIADISLYPDRILHSAICIALEDRLNAKLDPHVYSGRRNMGQHMAVSKISGYIRNDPRIKYALQIDIRQFYASIDKGILKAKLRTVIKDRRFLELMDVLIDGYPLPGIPLG